jgi:hypothetical protein
MRACPLSTTVAGVRLEILAIYGVPILAGAVTAGVLLGPGRAGPVDGLRVRALVAEGAEATSLALTTTRHAEGQRHPLQIDGLVVELGNDDASARWTGATSASGQADVNLMLPRPATGVLTLRIAGPLTAEGTITAQPPLPQTLTPPIFVEGEPRLSVWLPRGFAVPEMPEELVVTAATEGPDAKDVDDTNAATMEVQADGASIDPPGAPESTCKDGCVHTWRLRVVAGANTAQLTVTVTAARGTTRWQGSIPLAPGRIWLDPHARDWRLRAPHPVDEAQVVLLSPFGRLWATTVTMSVDDRGFATGAVEPPSPWPPGPRPHALALASDGEAEAAIWPLPPYGSGHLQARPEELVVDTLPEAIAAEDARATGARRPAYALVLAAGLFELIFLAHRARRSSRRLRRHLEGGLPPETARLIETRSPLWWLSVLTFGLVLAFVVLAGLAAFAHR